MSWLKGLALRSTADRGARGLLAIAAAVMGYVSVVQTLGYVLRADDAERAYTLAPLDGRIAALFAQKLSGLEATPADRARADRIAQEALRRDATSVAAASTLGLNAQARGDVGAARRIFAYAESLSRRDLQTQIWAIEDAVSRGDVAGALEHYDIALRTSRAAQDLLYPVLASAIAQPAVREALVRTLGRGSVWGGTFFDYVSGNGPDPVATLSLFFSLTRAKIAISDGANATILSKLVERGSTDAAWAYYVVLRPDADRRRSRDPRFTTNINVASPFDWILVNDGGVSTSIQRGDDGGILDFSVPASVGGTLIEQLQLLPVGDYRIEGRSIGIDQPDGQSPYWLLRCRDGRELGRVPVPNSTQANGAFAGRFRVPAGCQVQTLTLVARPSDIVSGLSGQIDRVLLSPVR